MCRYAARSPGRSAITVNFEARNLSDHLGHRGSGLNRLNGRAVDALDQQRQPAPEDLELVQQLFAIDVGAAKAVAIEGSKQPLQLDLGAG